MPTIAMDHAAAPPDLRLGTSSWSADDWVGPFYPPGTRPADYLAIYAEHFDTVECDATFYAIPTERTVEGWVAKTPESFLFAAKLPRAITHEAGMVGSEDTERMFLQVMDGLGPRLGPIVAQFAYVAKGKDPHEFATGEDFRRRLAAFIDRWPTDVDLVVEVRNGHWLKPPLLDLLRERSIGLVLPVIYTMPGPEELFRGPDPITADLVYVRFLGHHRRMDELVERLQAEGKRAGEWSELAVDKTAEMRRWVEPLRSRAERGKQVRVYFNNHYAGYAPGSLEAFRNLWKERLTDV